jgi:hypothetical protein
VTGWHGEEVTTMKKYTKPTVKPTTGTVLRGNA